MATSWTQVGADIDGENANDFSGAESSVSLSGDGSVVAIGSRLHDNNGGHVRIYKNENGTWTQIGSDIDGEAAGDLSGEFVSLSADGSVVAIGDQNNTRIFKNVEDSWLQIGSILGLGRSPISLSSDGSVIAIGSKLSVTGYVQIYKNVNNRWIQVGSKIEGEEDFDYSGSSISLSHDGSVVAIGAYGNDGNGINSGHARIYKNVNGSWNQIGEDIDGEGDYDYLGRFISISGDGSVVGIVAPRDEGAKQRTYLRVYKNLNDSWSQIGSDIIGEIAGDFPGGSVSVSFDGSIVAIGGYFDHPDPAESVSSHVRIFKIQSDEWIQVGSDIIEEKAGDFSGSAISLSSDGSTVAIGAYLNDGNGRNSGHVRVYSTDDTTPTITGPSGSEGDSTSTKSINENTTAVHTFSANESVTWSLNGGADAAKFSINSSTGTLSFSSAPDYESPTDSNSNNDYIVIVRAANSAGDTSDQTLKVSVVDVDESISGTPNNDNLKSTSSNDSIDGGEGIDTVSFTGNFSNYSFTRATDTLEIADQRSGTNDGTDTLSNIEYIKFSDQTVEESKVDVVKTYSGEFSDYKFYNKGNGIYQIKTDSGYDDITGIPLLTFTGETTTSSFREVSAIADIEATFDQVTGLNTDDAKMFRLYNASFKRLPDPDGLKYWIGKYTSGENDERAVASSFLVSDEFKLRYGNEITDSTYVNTLYKNVLGRDADSSGLNYWLGQLNSGAETRYEVLLGFAESAENKTLFTEMTGFG